MHDYQPSAAAQLVTTRITNRYTLNPRQVKLPEILVNCVAAAEQPGYHTTSLARLILAGLRARLLTVNITR